MACRVVNGTVLVVDVPAVLDSLHRYGYALIPQAAPIGMCDEMLTAIAEKCGVWLDRPGTWSQLSTELDQVPLWSHQAQ